MKGKKGMYFTIVTLIMIFIFVFVFLIAGRYDLNSRLSVVEMRVESMNDFIKDLRRDTERGLYITSFRAILSIEEYVINNGAFINDSNGGILELLLNGTIYGTSSPMMTNSKLTDWMDNIVTEAGKLNINLSMDVKNITVFQDAPWSVRINMTLGINVSDEGNIASWVRDEVIETTVDIVDFEDPLYIVFSGGRITNQIKRSVNSGNFTKEILDTWDVGNLINHINNSEYIFNPDAPSFLMRLENNTNSSACCGIESLVNIKKLELAGFQAYEINSESSVVDHDYWQGISNGDYRVNFTPEWFRLDGDHLDSYNVTSISYMD